MDANLTVTVIALVAVTALACATIAWVASVQAKERGRTGSDRMAAASRGGDAIRYEIRPWSDDEGRESPKTHGERTQWRTTTGTGTYRVTKRTERAGPRRSSGKMTRKRRNRRV